MNKYLCLVLLLSTASCFGAELEKIPNNLSEEGTGYKDGIFYNKEDEVISADSESFKNIGSALVYACIGKKEHWLGALKHHLKESSMTYDEEKIESSLTEVVEKGSEIYDIAKGALVKKNYLEYQNVLKGLSLWRLNQTFLLKIGAKKNHSLTIKGDSGA